MGMDRQQLARLRELNEKATGPFWRWADWSLCPGEMETSELPERRWLESWSEAVMFVPAGTTEDGPMTRPPAKADMATLVLCEGGGEAGDNEDADKALIAAMRNALPELLRVASEPVERAVELERHSRALFGVLNALVEHYVELGYLDLSYDPEEMDVVQLARQVLGEAKPLLVDVGK